MAVVRLNTAGSDEPATPQLVSLDQTLIVFDVDQRKNATQNLKITRLPKAGLVSFRFQTNAPTRYIVNPNWGVIADDNPIPVKIELVDNRYNPQHKLILQAIAIKNKNEWKTIWDQVEKMDPPLPYQNVWIEMSTTLMNLEHTHNLTEPEAINAEAAVAQILTASTTKGKARVKELKDLKALLDADTNTILMNIEQTNILKKVIEAQLAERASQAEDLRLRTEKLKAEEKEIQADLNKDEAELKVFKDRRAANPENCATM
ncbi:unnamed protein product [Nippostrongylus brasiliensis]|uniref:Major sperm protein n=1 Tax=Nippostrongylus brasiliensis TaxID=27835 RepID=A0A0N4Y1G2_NIPBR|nr:unnamed protein product [Nippostrongylus brasiliensis]